MIAENLKARAEQFTPRINSRGRHALGPDFSAPTKMAALKVATRLNGSAYGPILNSGATVDVTPVRDMIANTRVDPILAGVKEDPISSALAKAQSLVVGSNPAALPINVAHQAQCAIGDMADSAARSGKNAEARALTGVRSALLDQMPDAYNAARKQYATDKSVEEAFTEGRSLFALAFGRSGVRSRPVAGAHRWYVSARTGCLPHGGAQSCLRCHGTSRSDPAGLQTKLSNQNGYAVTSCAPYSVTADERHPRRVGQSKGLQATNNLALRRVQDSDGQLGRRVHADGQDYGRAGQAGHGILGSLRLGQLVSAAVHWLAVRLARCLVSLTWVWRLAQLEEQLAPLRLHSSTPAGWRRKGQTAQLRRGC